MSVRPDDAPEHMAAEVEEALAEDPRVSEQGLRVRIRDGVVEVHGIISTAPQLDGVREVVAELLPQHHLELDVRVAGEDVTETGGSERLR